MIKKIRILSEAAAEQTGVLITPSRERIKKVRIRPDTVQQRAVISNP